MAKVGILTFSDGREFVHKQHVELGNLSKFHEPIVERLKRDGHEVVAAEFVWRNDIAVREARRLSRGENVDCVIFNHCVWDFPHLSAIAAAQIEQPIIQVGNVNPGYPGMVGFLASCGAIDQIGKKYWRAFGELDSPTAYPRIAAFIRAAEAIRRLNGEVYGLFGGRPMGMYTAQSNADQWMKQFKVDIEHIDQYELVLRAEKVKQSKVDKAIKWLEKMGATIHWDKKVLTLETLGREIRLYYAVRELCEEAHLDFCGIKNQTELSNNYVVPDLAEALLMDPYDFDGKKPMIVCATEADTDAALTMEIFKHLSKTPVLFADVRHYHNDLNVFDFCNSGQHATYFAAKSFDPKDNLPHVHLYPALQFYFKAGGASVHHLAAEGEMTFARLMRKDGQYWMGIVHGESVHPYEGDRQKIEALMKMTTPEWPHLFARLDSSAQTFLDTFSCNHIHGVYGNYVVELKLVCEMLDVKPVVIE